MVRTAEFAMANHSSSSTASRQHHARRRERRQQFSVFLTALASRPAGLGGALDAAMCALVPIRAARLVARSIDAIPEPKAGAPAVLRFPVQTPTRPGLYLEVDLGPSCGLDSWDRQLLRDAARVLGLMLDSRQEVAGATDERPADGAAPIIGSSVCMQRLREQIERVAATDFTVLIEGETGSQ